MSDRIARLAPHRTPPRRLSRRIAQQIVRFVEAQGLAPPTSCACCRPWGGTPPDAGVSSRIQVRVER